MVYVSNGQVLDSRSQSPWSLSFITDLFWGVVEFVGLFFHSLFQPDLSKKGTPGSSSSSRFDDGRGPPRFPGGRRMGREVDEEGKRLHKLMQAKDAHVHKAGLDI
ncbi:selenoprotein K-like [Acipenser oxyrinchus oxyrinchus]|uniref:Selenoprotein K n=1 Tax=Acipenser oxyrinchus oxyrinchus TaxID=40147 RepID=A0AAD8CVB5_ACIOX|nr:selenoprotein K-like [Acipenser oxyrinchus oxyrinchus]